MFESREGVVDLHLLAFAGLVDDGRFSASAAGRER